MTTHNNTESGIVREIELDDAQGTITYSHGNIGRARVDDIVDEYAVPGYTGLRENDDLDRPVVRIKTFGNFTISIDDKPVVFTARRGAEYLAILVDAQGVPVDKSVIKSYLYEEDYAKGVSDDKLDSRFRGLKKSVNDQLKDLGIEFILKSASKGQQNIDVTTIKCDLYDYLRYGGNSNVKYYGVYMQNFDWAHRTATAARLDGEFQSGKDKDR